MFVAVGQRYCKFWPCGVFEVTGGGVKGTHKSCGANVLFLKIKNFKKKILKIARKKIKKKDFVSCVMVYDVVRFVLRYFLGFLAGFCVLCGKLSRLHRENGLERLKMRFCYSGIIILMLLRYSKRGCCGNYARAQVCVYVYMYTL